MQLFLAGFWGLVAGSALIIGALVGFYFNVPQRLVAAIMSFGGGVLISTLSFDLMDEAYKRGGFNATAAGFIAGAAIYTFANPPAQQRRRSPSQTLRRPRETNARE